MSCAKCRAVKLIRRLGIFCGLIDVAAFPIEPIPKRDIAVSGDVSGQISTRPSFAILQKIGTRAEQLNSLSLFVSILHKPCERPLLPPGILVVEGV